MRSFEEQKAEVFRRSRERIKKNKQIRKTIILSGIPLMLCLVVSTAFYCKPQEKNDIDKAIRGDLYSAEEICIRISDLSGERVISDSQVVNDIMKNILVMPEAGSAEQDCYTVAEESVTEAEIYTITVNDGNGNTMILL